MCIERRKRLVRAVPSRATDRGGVMNALHSCCGLCVLLAPGAGCAAASCAWLSRSCVYGSNIMEGDLGLEFDGAISVAAQTSSYKETLKE